MKILVDTNILMSAVWRSESHIAKVLKRPDFLVLDLDKPKCLTVAEFCE